MEWCTCLIENPKMVDFSYCCNMHAYMYVYLRIRGYSGFCVIVYYFCLVRAQLLLSWQQLWVEIWNNWLLIVFKDVQNYGSEDLQVYVSFPCFNLSLELVCTNWIWIYDSIHHLLSISPGSIKHYVDYWFFLREIACCYDNNTMLLCQRSILLLWQQYYITGLILVNGDLV